MPDWRLQLPERRRPQLRLWFCAIAAATMVVVMVGGVTRLTHSGLSIVEWQPILGVIPPLNDAQWADAFARYRRFPEYRQLRPAMTLDEFKGIYFWEYLHRLLARAIGLVFVVPFLVFWRAGALPRPLAHRAIALFGLGAMQGGVGWLMVKSGLLGQPSVSHYRLAVHLVIAFVILGFAVWLALDLAVTRTPEAPIVRTPRAMARWCAALGALLVAQIVWGAFVAGIKAGLVDNTFPLMGGRLMPRELLAWEPLLSNFVRNPIAVQWVHRVLGTALLVFAVCFQVHVHSTTCDRRTRRLVAALAGAIAAQYLLGVLTLVYQVPIGLAVLHQMVAGVVVVSWVGLLHHLLTGNRA